MMMTRAQFIRDVKKPGASVKKTIHNGSTWQEILAGDPDKNYGMTQRLEDHMNRFRLVDHVQTNSFRIEGSWLDFPNAKQMDYDGKTINIYHVGYRPLNVEEQQALDEWKLITSTDKYKQDAYYDAMTDYSGTFYQEKRFYADKGLDYMFGVSNSQGKRRVSYYMNAKGERIEGDFIQDNSIRGEIAFAYEIKFQ